MWVGGQTIKDRAQGTPAKEGGWKMDEWVEGERMEGQVREQDGRRRKKNNKLQIRLKEREFGISRGNGKYVCVNGGGLL